MKKTTTILATVVLVMFLTVNAFAWSEKIMGQPELKPGKDNGIFFWLDKDGFHVRVTSPKKTVFTGSMVAPDKIDFTKTYNLKNGDFVKKYMGPSYISAGEFKSWKVFYTNLKQHKTAPWKRIWQLMPEETQKLIAALNKGKKLEKDDAGKIINGLNNVIMNKNIYDEKAFKGVALTPEATGFIKRGTANLCEEELQRLNRLLIEAICDNTILPSENELLKFRITVNKDIKGFDYKVNTPYLDFTICKMNDQRVKRMNFRSGAKKVDLEHTPFRIYDIGNPNTKMNFPH